MLFIYVVLSLFIAIIMDTYENIKEYYKVGNYCYNQGFHHILKVSKKDYLNVAMANKIFLSIFSGGFPAFKS